MQNIRSSLFHPLYLISMLLLTWLVACSTDITGTDWQKLKLISIEGDIEQIAATRVNDSGFSDGDVMGVYVVDYVGATPGTLKTNGNHGDNVSHTFDEANGKWNSAYDMYWTDDHTHIDIYSYYPYGEPSDVNNYQFEVARDQSKASADNDMGGYEASDFLWGKAEDVAPTATTIRLPMRHRMACARVTLEQGSGFSEGEWEQTDKSVLATNLVRKASINMADGSVKPDGNVENTATMPSKRDSEWRAIVVPQTVAGGTTLFAITVGGQAFKFARSGDFTYTAGKMSNFTIRVDKKLPEGTYKLTLTGESITPWENDLVSHDATTREYVIVHSTPGNLKDSIQAAHKDYTKVKNLKVTGGLNNLDITFMRKDMTSLQALNMKEARIKNEAHNYGGGSDPGSEEDVLPNSAFADKLTLTRVILPDTLKKIGSSFAGCLSLTGSVIIPEGVTEIGGSAFMDCHNLNNIFPLPSTVKTIGMQAFLRCTNLTGKLVLPNNLEKIDESAFHSCSGLSGEIKLPETLKSIGSRAFAGCSGLSGSLTIPKHITVINSSTFEGCGFDGSLTLHDGITFIHTAAFNNCHFKGELRLPKDLGIITTYAFGGNDFSGKLVLPKNLSQIETGAFFNNQHLSGIVEFPEGLQSIGGAAFESCGSIEGIVLPESMENLRQGAFRYCYGIGSIVCNGDTPPTLWEGAFDGVATDNFTVEVPEQSVTQYQTAAGWKDFKRIAAHHELTCRPSVACALNTEHRQTLTLNAEGDWEVASKPDWCRVSPMSGSKKTEVTLTIGALPKGAADRTGEVVFRLKDKDYTHSCNVSQYNYQYGEDEWLTLQKATKGRNGGINIVILGDGFNAKEIANGTCLSTMRQAAEHFFAIEPYTTYRDYFNVYTAFPISTETGVGTVNTMRYNRFGTAFSNGIGLKADYDDIFNYALNAPTVTKDNLKQTLIIIVPNSTDYGGITQMWEDGSAIAFCPKTTYEYPLDWRGIIQHEAGGHGFGKLADEYIYHNAFIDACRCTCCGHADAVRQGKNNGWFDNISLSGKANAVPWSHLIYDKRYSDIVDIYEGAFMHSRGVFRSEQNSCMNNDIPYFSTISRESIVKRIKSYAGEAFSFEDFVKNDKKEPAISPSPSAKGRVAVAVTRAYSGNKPHKTARATEHAPLIHKGSPLKNNNRKHR